MCVNCKKENLIDSTTPFTVDLEDKLIVVRGVPCKRCLYCDDVEFSDKVAAKLETIVESLKQSDKRICIVSFSQKAA